MRSKKFLWKICEEIYTEMYKVADPPLDFHLAVKQGITAKPNWFMNYYLPAHEAEEIVNKIVKKYKCNKQELDRKSVV